MNKEEAEIYAKTMTYEDALYNLSQARAIPYKKATLIKVYELIQTLSQEPMREFTEEESKAYSKALDKMYKPTGFNVFDEPCDAISRQTYADWLDWLCRLRSEINSGMDMARVPQGHRDKYIDVLTEVIDKLPSVTHKSGKWILTIEDWNKWTCSNCGYVKRTDIHVNIGWKYCPNCGCRMVEPQESEDKE